MATGKKKRSNAIEVDFEGVESGGGSRAVPDGTYSVSVAGPPSKEEGADSGEAYLSWKFKITKGKHKGVTLYDNTSLQPQALWKLKTLLEAMGEEVPDSSMRLVPSEYVDRELQVEVVNEEYNGRDKSKIVGYIIEGGEEDDGSDDDEKDEDEDEEDAKPAKKKSSKKDEDEEEESEEEESEESEDEDDEEDEKPKGKGKRALARAAAKKGKKSDDDDDDADDESEEEEEEEDEKPAKKGGSSKVKKGARVSFDDDGKTVKGKVTDIDGSVATVDVKGDEWQVQIEDLTVIA